MSISAIFTNIDSERGKQISTRNKSSSGMHFISRDRSILPILPIAAQEGLGGAMKSSVKNFSPLRRKVHRQKTQRDNVILCSDSSLSSEVQPHPSSCPFLSHKNSYIGTSHPTRAFLTAVAPRRCFRPLTLMTFTASSDPMCLQIQCAPTLLSQCWQAGN